MSLVNECFDFRRGHQLPGPSILEVRRAAVAVLAATRSTGKDVLVNLPVRMAIRTLEPPFLDWFHRGLWLGFPTRKRSACGVPRK